MHSSKHLEWRPAHRLITERDLNSAQYLNLARHLNAAQHLNKVWCCVSKKPTIAFNGQKR